MFMKRTGRHPEKALTAVQVRALSKPGRYADGNGLYLVIEPSGAKRWILRTLVQGKRRDMGLGGLSLVTLAEAREKALAYRKLAREGGDPFAERRKARATCSAFAEAADKVHAEHKVAWKNPKHAAQWLTTLKSYAIPVIGDRRVDPNRHSGYPQSALPNLAGQTRDGEKGAPAHRDSAGLGEGSGFSGGREPSGRCCQGPPEADRPRQASCRLAVRTGPGLHSRDCAPPTLGKWCVLPSSS